MKYQLPEMSIKTSTLLPIILLRNYRGKFEVKWEIITLQGFFLIISGPQMENVYNHYLTLEHVGAP